MPPATAAAVAAIGATALAGWTFDVPALRSVVPGLVAMNPATALALLLAAAGLWHAAGSAPAPSRAATALGATVALIGLWRLADYAVGLPAGIDRLLFTDRLDAFDPPNRMAPNTAVCFVVAGTALAVLRVRARGWRHPAPWLALALAAFALLAVTGYAYLEDEFVRVGGYIPMALNTAGAFLLLSIGLLVAAPAPPALAALLAAGRPGARARVLLAAGFAVPVGLGGVLLWGERAGLYGHAYGTVLFAVATAAILAAVVGWSAVQAQRAAEAEAGQLAELQALNRELETFSYSASHDLRAPLRAIDGFSRILEEDHAPALDAEARRLLGVVRQNARRMGELIDDLLRFSRYSRVAVEPIHVDMRALAGQALADLDGPAREAGAQVAIGALPPATGDPALLRQVWANLLGNAIKYRRAGVTPRIEVTGRMEGGEAVYSVGDNGIGFDPAYADRLFAVFQRLHHDDAYEGTGVGLAIVQRIVHRHGGRTWAEGEPGRGAAFHFSLPAGEPRHGD